MKRVYFKKGKSVLRQRTIDQIRHLRAKITAENPGLLESVRGKLPQSESIDRQKNLHTVMKFMELKQTSPAFNAKLKSILSESKI